MRNAKGSSISICNCTLQTEVIAIGWPAIRRSSNPSDIHLPHNFSTTTSNFWLKKPFSIANAVPYHVIWYIKYRHLHRIACKSSLCCTSHIVPFGLVHCGFMAQQIEFFMVEWTVWPHRLPFASHCCACIVICCRGYCARPTIWLCKSVVRSVSGIDLPIRLLFSFFLFFFFVICYLLAKFYCRLRKWYLRCFDGVPILRVGPVPFRISQDGWSGVVPALIWSFMLPF